MFGTRPVPLDPAEAEDTMFLNNTTNLRKRVAAHTSDEEIASRKRKRQENVTIVDWNNGETPLGAWLNQSAVPDHHDPNPVIETTQGLRLQQQSEREQEDLKFFRRVHMSSASDSDLSGVKPETIDADMHKPLEFGAQVYYRNIVDKFPLIPRYLARRLAEANDARAKRLKSQDLGNECIVPTTRLDSDQSKHGSSQVAESAIEAQFVSLSDRQHATNVSQSLLQWQSQSLHLQSWPLPSLLTYPVYPSPNYSVDSPPSYPSYPPLGHPICSLESDPACLPQDFPPYPPPSHPTYAQPYGYPLPQAPAPRQGTAIKCKNCRKRKVRLVLSSLSLLTTIKIRCSGYDSSSAGRCANCVRYDLECLFHPVSSQAAFVPASIVYTPNGVDTDQPHRLYGPHGQPLGPAAGQRPPTSIEATRTDVPTSNWYRQQENFANSFDQSLYRSHRGSEQDSGSFWTGGSPRRRSASVHSGCSSMNSSLRGDGPKVDPADQNPVFPESPGSHGKRDSSRSLPGLPPPPVELGKQKSFECDICKKTIRVQRRREWQ